MRSNENNSEPPRITACIDLDRQVRSMEEVLGIQIEDLPTEQWTRAQILFMRAAIGKSLRDHLTDRHVLLSFYIPTAGFVVQHVACDLQLPHVACSRGSDLGHALFIQKDFAAIGFVLNRASHVITTNSEHKRLIGNVCGRRHGVQTIYNGFATTLQTAWQPNRREHVKIVSLGGYCIKKGTHLLLEAVGLLIEEGLPIELEIAGPTRLGAWDSLRQKYTARYGSRVKLNDWIPQSELMSFLKGGDIFCSASLSEGCSNAALLALGLGMPIVSARTGALPDLASNWSHVEFVEVGDVSELARGLRNAVNKIRTGKMVVAQDEVQRLLMRLCPEAEVANWRDLLIKVADFYRPPIPPGGRPVKPLKRL